MHYKLTRNPIFGICLVLLFTGCAGRASSNAIVEALPQTSASVPAASAPVRPTALDISTPEPINRATRIPASDFAPVMTAPPPIQIGATFSTSYKDGSKNRIHNIQRAAAAINGIVLESGGEFSYNDAVGPTTKANGYKKARIFVRGKDAEGYGGGVCQVSSTLYNVAESAGLTILERHPHSKAVSYVAKDRDAATSFGGIDLRLANPYPFAVRIAAVATDEMVTVTVSQQ